ncbi:MAG: MFS transporter [Coxiellaceae bacterium]|nr:MAG: MFS transporter [Coxiellaceae bacterium]
MQLPENNGSKYYPWLIWGLGAAFFFVEYFARVSPSVMVPELMQSFQIKALGIGTLSACFYYAYISMQVPVGALVDRFGAHRLLTVTAIICASGCFLFAFSQHILLAQLARLLMGFGAAFAFVGTLKLATLWFPPHRFGLLAGMTQALGMLGVAVALSSLAVTVHALGWRMTVGMIGMVLLILAILIGIFVRDRPIIAATSSKSTIGLWQGLVLVLRNPQTWVNAAFAGLLYAPTAAFAELWGVSYLVRVYSISTSMAATAVSVIFIGWAVGGPLMGWISDSIQKRRPVMMFSIMMSFLLMTIILYLPPIWLPLLFLLLFAYGVVNAGLVVSYAVASEINFRPIAGTSMAFSNMASVIIGAALQPIIGFMLDMFSHGVVDNNGMQFYSAQDYRMSMVALPLCLLLGSVVVLWVKETYCKVREE